MTFSVAVKVLLQFDELGLRVDFCHALNLSNNMFSRTFLPYEIHKEHKERYTH